VCRLARLFGELGRVEVEGDVAMNRTLRGGGVMNRLLGDGS